MGEKTAGPTHNFKEPQVAKLDSTELPTSLSQSPLGSSAFSIDESAEFHDPYSDLNIFLASKIKEEIKSSDKTKKWSVYLQEKLIDKITPEFKRRFPHYRLGVAALKKIWEKVAYFSAVFENQKEAITADGKLNIRFLIRENLKQFLSNKKSFTFHPYLLAQQLALKISECLATYDGTRPMLQHITKIIWAAQRHLIPPEQIPTAVNPYDEFDKWDKLIIKFMLQALGKKPLLTQEELQDVVRYTLQNPSLEEETRYIHIDSPHLTFTEAEELAYQFITKTRELSSSANWIEIEHKITLWTIQNDLVHRCLKIEKNPLLELIGQNPRLSITKLTSQFLQSYPHLLPYLPEITARAETFSRYAWYNLFSSPQESSIERYYLWQLKEGITGAQLEEVFRKQLPLLPFVSNLKSIKAIAEGKQIC